MTLGRLPRPSTGFLLLVATGILWGTTGAAATGVFERTTLGAPALAWLRFVAAVPFVTTVGWQAMGRGLIRMPARAWLTMAALGAMTMAFQLFYLYAVQEIGVTAGTLICLCAIPTLVATFSTVVQGERHGRATWLSIVVALALLVLLVLGDPGGGAGDGRVPLGVLFALLSAVGAAAYTLAGRSVSRRHEPTQILFGAVASGTVLFSPFALTGGVSLHLPVSAWLLIGYLGVVSQGVAYLCFQRGLETESATTASVVTLLEPLVAALLGWWLLGERLSAVSWGGAALLVGALLLTTTGSRGVVPALAPVAPGD